jgi:hypothetical protein
MKSSILALGSIVATLALSGCAPEIIYGGDGDQSNAGKPSNGMRTVINRDVAPKNVVSPGDREEGTCEGAEVHVVGIYDPYNNATNTQGPATVHIEREGQVALVLTSYSATDWTVTAGPNTEIVSVTAAGYENVTVTAPAGVPTTVLSYVQNQQFLGCGYEYPDQDPWSGCETPELLDAVTQYAGQSVSSFHGCYAASDFVINADLTSSSNCAVDMGYAHTNMVANGCSTPNPPDPNDPPPNPLPNNCDGKEGLGLYNGFMCDTSQYPGGNPFIITEQISCEDALSNCILNASSNPGYSFRCTWNGEEIYLLELQAGICSP